MNDGCDGGLAHMLCGRGAGYHMCVCACMYGVCVHVCMSSHAKDRHELQTMSTLGLAPQRLLMRLARRVHPGDLSERTDRGRGLVLPI